MLDALNAGQLSRMIITAFEPRSDAHSSQERPVWVKPAHSAYGSVRGLTGHTPSGHPAAGKRQFMPFYPLVLSLGFDPLNAAEIRRVTMASKKPPF